MKKKISVVLVVAILCLVLVACGQKDNAFVGTWSGETAEEMTITAIFMSNNKVTLTLGAQGVSGTYSIDGDIATIKVENGSADATATLADDKLIFIANGEAVEMKKTN